MTTYAGAHKNLDNALRIKGDLEGAIKECREAIRLDPKDGYPHYILGFVYEKKGMGVLAADEFETYVRLAPSAEFTEKARQKARELRQKN